ncbi:MAG: TIGR00153 family protein [Nevskiales bacterium]|nr:TIGR00153 family protein [Nevskiales bacterium]
MSPKSFVAEMFGASPIRPLQSHMEKVCACVERLQSFIQAAVDGEWETAARLQQEISTREQEADALKHELRRHLPARLMMAVDRRDVLELLAMQDKVANTAKDIAGLMYGRRMVPPPELAPGMVAFVRRAVAAVMQADRAIEELDELLEAGFRGAEVGKVHQLLDELDQIEADTDRQQVDLRAALMALEARLPPVDVMFLYQTIEWIGDLADRAQRVGSRLHVLMAN